MTRSEVHPEPVPLLVLRHGPVAARQLAALRGDARVELFEPEEWTPDALVLSQRVAVTLVATMGDPMRALTYAVTAGVTGNVVMATSARYRAQRSTLIDAGALAVCTMPLSSGEVESLLGLVDPRPPMTRTDTTLRLTLDPIARVARHRDHAVQLSQREFAVLHCLSTHGGKPVDADEMLRVVWGNAVSSDRPRQILDVYVCQLRRKLDAIGLTNAIATVRGFGYALGKGPAR